MQKIISFLVFAVLLCGAAAAQEDDAVWFELYEQIDYSELRSLVDAGNVESARIFNDGTWVTVKTKDGEFLIRWLPPKHRSPIICMRREFRLNSGLQIKMMKPPRQMKRGSGKRYS